MKRKVIIGSMCTVLALGGLSACQPQDTPTETVQTAQKTNEDYRKIALDKILAVKGVERYAFYQPSESDEPYLMVGTQADDVDNWYGTMSKINFYRYDEASKEYKIEDGVWMYAGTSFLGTPTDVYASRVLLDKNNDIVIQEIPDGHMGYWYVYRSSYKDGKLEIHELYRTDRPEAKQYKDDESLEVLDKIMKGGAPYIKWTPVVHTADAVASEEIEAEKKAGHKVMRGTIRYLTKDELYALPEVKDMPHIEIEYGTTNDKYLVIVFDETHNIPVYTGRFQFEGPENIDMKVAYLGELNDDEFTGNEELDGKDVYISIDTSGPIDVTGAGRSFNYFAQDEHGLDFGPLKMPVIALYKIL